MRILITGICGFVGSELALALPKLLGGAAVFGIDNFVRPGSETNRLRLAAAGIGVRQADVRCASDLDAVGPADWVIEAAANPSVLAGVDGKVSSRQLVEHNLIGTFNTLEYCKRHNAGIALISTSRVYGAHDLAKIPVKLAGAGSDAAFVPDAGAGLPIGCSIAGIAPEFSTRPPLSLYGASKLASETLALEYGQAFSLPVIINRCGVMAGGGQFGVADQGIFSYWVRSYAARRPLKYIGFDGTGHQVRDALHPRDLAALLAKQIARATAPVPAAAPASAAPIWNVGGGPDNAMSLVQLSHWCRDRFAEHTVAQSPEPRRWDAPWIVMDARKTAAAFDWKPAITLGAILEEIAAHHEKHPNFLDLSAG